MSCVVGGRYSEEKGNCLCNGGANISDILNSDGGMTLSVSILFIRPLILPGLDRLSLESLLVAFSLFGSYFVILRH